MVTRLSSLSLSLSLFPMGSWCLLMPGGLGLEDWLRMKQVTPRFKGSPLLACTCRHALGKASARGSLHAAGGRQPYTGELSGRVAGRASGHTCGIYISTTSSE